MIAGNQPREAEAAIHSLDLPVDVVASSAGWGVSKPDPRFFANVIEAAGVPAHAIAYDAALAQIEALLTLLVPRYRAEGKAYVTVAIGCTGGRHRSVHVAERIGARLRAEGFSPTITHRDLGAAPQDSLEGSPASK